MAVRSASGDGGLLCKRIVRKIGADLLPLEALDSLKNTTTNVVTDNKKMVDESSRGNFANRHIQFRINNNNNSKRTWKPNLQLKRLFTYLHDCDIQPKVTIHAVKCVDRTGGVDKYLVKTPYYKSETEMGLLWKGKIEGKYVEFWNKEVGYFSPQEESKIEKALQELNLSRK